MSPDTGALLLPGGRIDEIVEATIETCDGWFPDGPIDWETVFDRMEGQRLADGSELSWGDQYDTPAMRKVQRKVREYRRNAG